MVAAVKEAVAPLQDRMARLESAQGVARDTAVEVVRDALGPIQEQFNRIEAARQEDRDRAAAGHELLISEIQTCSGDMRALAAQVTATAARVDRNREETEKRLTSFDALIQERLENLAKARRVDSAGATA